MSNSAADRIIDHLGPRSPCSSASWFRKDTVLIVDGTLVPTSDHQVAEQSKNYGHSLPTQSMRWLGVNTCALPSFGVERHAEALQCDPKPEVRDDKRRWQQLEAMDT